MTIKSENAKRIRFAIQTNVSHIIEQNLILCQKVQDMFKCARIHSKVIDTVSFIYTIM